MHKDIKVHCKKIIFFIFLIYFYKPQKIKLIIMDKKDERE